MDSETKGEHVMTRREFLSLPLLLLRGPLPYLLAMFTRTSRRLPYMGFYHANAALDLLPRGSFVIFAPGNDSSLTGIDFSARGLLPVAYLGDDALMFELDARCVERFTADKAWLASRGIAPLALMWGEEWYLRINGDVGTWPYFKGFTGLAKKDRLRERVDQILDILHTVFAPNPPPIVQVETVWNADPTLGGYTYYAPPFMNADILGLDAYLTTGGVSALSTPPLTANADQNMLDKFWSEVGQFAEHAAGYRKPLMIVGQAFHASDPASPWFVPPTPAQLEWFYILAQRTPAIIGVAWFAVAAEAGGLLRSDMASQAAKVKELWAYNQSL